MTIYVLILLDIPQAKGVLHTMSGEQPECSISSPLPPSSLISSIDSTKPKISCGRERPVYKHALHTHKAFESLNEMRRFVNSILICYVENVVHARFKLWHTYTKEVLDLSE